MKFQRTWSRVVCKLIGIRIEVFGDLPGKGNWLGVSNHIGYADVLVLGSILPVTFVSKAEVSRWPLVNSLAALAGTEFVNRECRCSAGAFAQRIAARISAGDNLLLFPEGTSTRGENVLPFKTVPFAAIVGEPGKTVIPIYVDVVEIDGIAPAGRYRDTVCWHGEADFLPHLFHLLELRRIVYRVVIGSPISGKGHDRKTLAHVSRERVVSLGKVSARRRFPALGNYLWIHPPVP